MNNGSSIFDLADNSMPPHGSSRLRRIDVVREGPHHRRVITTPLPTPEIDHGGVVNTGLTADEIRLWNQWRHIQKVSGRPSQ